MIRELRPELREELRRLVEDRPSAVLDLGDRRVLLAVIETDREYDLDNDLADPVIAETVARGWEDYRAGRLVEHEDILRRLRTDAEDQVDGSG